MMRGVGGVVAVAVTALLVCCSADPHQGQDVASAGEHSSSDRYGHKTRNLDQLGGGNLVRAAREARPLPYLLPRQYNAIGSKNEAWPAGKDLIKFYKFEKRNFDEIDRSDLNPFIGKRNFDEIDRSDLNPFIGKRNFDEIDRSYLDNFIGKRNFDEIDQTSMPFPYATKRVYHVYGNNYIDAPLEWRSGFDKKRYRPDYPMDEIDVTHFPIGYKRSVRLE